MFTGQTGQWMIDSDGWWEEEFMDRHVADPFPLFRWYIDQGPGRPSFYSIHRLSQTSWQVSVHAQNPMFL